MIARAASVVSDGIVLVLTLMKTHRYSGDLTMLSEPSQTIRSVLLRNGRSASDDLCLARWFADTYNLGSVCFA